MQPFSANARATVEHILAFVRPLGEENSCLHIVTCLCQLPATEVEIKTGSETDSRHCEENGNVLKKIRTVDSAGSEIPIFRLKFPSYM